MAIQIGKYKRPGIFLEENDNSVISSPTVNGITTMVIGFSKKGPVNTPVLLTNTGDASTIFGTLDRNLERKGSFFHRTVSKMLESSPVYGINLLLTDDNLDKVDYKSLSTSAIFANDATRSGAYRKLFDTTGFWKRDTDAFINLVNLDASQIGDRDRLLNITNLGDAFVTVFIFKSKVSGYDRTLLEWYGSIDKLPSYLNESDWASDYMVDVMIVGGEWSDYTTLSTDTRWSRYFNTSGLIKDQIYNFANNTLVNLLGFYEGLSLIPYFRDSNNNNVFIETVLNRDTDKTGIFTAFNSDLFETDVQNNKIDLIGNSLVGTTASSIDFLSYKEVLVEDIEFNEIYLDRPGNVFGIGATGVHAIGSNHRSGYYSEGYVNDMTNTYTGGATGISITFTANTTPFAVINEELITFETTAFTFVGSTAAFPGSITEVESYKYAFVLDSTGLITKIGGLGLSSYPQVDASSIVLSAIDFTVNNGSITIIEYVGVTITTNSGYKELVLNTDYKITNVGSSASAELKVEFLNTSGSVTTRDYQKYRKVKQFNYLLSLLNSNNSAKGTMIVNNSLKKSSLSTMSVKDINTSTLNNKSLTLVPNLTLSEVSDILTSGKLVVYKIDDEFIIGTDGINETTAVATSNYGSLGQWSPFNQAYLQGNINIGDSFVDGDDTTIYLAFNEVNNTTLVQFVTAEGANAQAFNLNGEITVTSNKSNFKQSIEIEEVSGYTPVSNKILVNASRYSEVKVGDFLASNWEEGWLTDPNYDADREPRRMVRITSKKLYAGNNTLVEITTDGAIKKSDSNDGLYTTRYSQLEDYVNAYTGITLKGFRVRNESMPDGSEERQNAILNLVAKGTPLYKAITNKDAIDFRYLVDGFGLGLTELSKQQLVDICGSRLDAFGFISMPSLKSFKNSTSPSFVNDEGVLQVEYIAMGGNPESSPAFNYSFADGDGSTAVGYFLPYVTVDDNGRPAEVPPAMYVADTYMKKHNSNVTTITPYTISAGVVNGKVTGIGGLEKAFDNEDIEFLYGAKMNPIVYKRNRGYSIETENTALTQYTSALSYIHTREVLIELERELAAMLLDFQWKYNTPDVRAEIKLRADVICGKYVSKGGLYAFFNKCDDENNTKELIGNQIGVLDTYVEPTMGLGTIVNNVTILSNGAIQSGGFRLQ